MFDKDTGVKGGETLAWGISEFWVVSRGLEIFIAIALKLLDGMEKLRDTTWEGVGSGDAEFDTNDLPLGCMWPLGANSDEWTAKGLEDLGVELDGGLGSSWSSLILGEDTKVGEAIGDTLGDTLGEEGSCTVGFWKKGSREWSRRLRVNWFCRPWLTWNRTRERKSFDFLGI